MLIEATDATVTVVVVIDADSGTTPGKAWVMTAATVQGDATTEKIAALVDVGFPGSNPHNMVILQLATLLSSS